MDRFVIRKRKVEEEDNSRRVKQKTLQTTTTTTSDTPTPSVTIETSTESTVSVTNDVPLTAEQMQTIADNKRAAIAKRKQKQQEQQLKVIERSEDTSVWDLLSMEATKIETFSQFAKEFDVIADKLLNGVELVINGKPHRFCEIEFYLKGGIHQDIFTHCDSQQLSCAQWYFHKNGNRYRTGNYKGLDITFAKEDNCHGGILIRSLEDLSDHKLYDGPCVCVNHILSLVGCADVTDIVQIENFSWEANKEESCLYLRHPSAPLARRNIVNGPRVGLTLKRKGGDRPSYIGMGYRYLSMPKQIKKGKPNMIVGLHKKGKGPADIHNITGTALVSVNRYIELYEEGKKESFSLYEGMELETNNLCKLFGACAGLEKC